MTRNELPPGRLLDWTPAEAARFGKVAQKSRHRAHELPWYSEDALRDLIREYPRTQLRVFTSGDDPTRRTPDHQPVDTEGATAEEILAAVRVGRLWVNLQRIDQVDPRFKELGDRLYGELARDCPHFCPVWINRAFLFVSSPNAQVYLHADYQPNMLWHIRGEKTIWIYPAYDPRIVSIDRMEEICAGGEDDIDFRPEFDGYGSAFRLLAGDAVSWPARSPHRVLNGPTVNVSLSTFHETEDDYVRVCNHRANHFFRRISPALANAGSDGSLVMNGKRVVHKVLSRVGAAAARSVKEYYAHYRIDPDAPHGIRRLADGPVLTEHSRLVRAASARPRVA